MYGTFQTVSKGDHFEDLEADKSIILKWNLCGFGRHLCGSGQRPLGGGGEGGPAVVNTVIRFSFHLSRGISLMKELLSACQNGSAFREINCSEMSGSA
jgi:hypothetical protein